MAIKHDPALLAGGDRVGGADQHDGDRRHHIKTNQQAQTRQLERFPSGSNRKEGIPKL
jgi:hypothetical protein